MTRTKIKLILLSLIMFIPCSFAQQRVHMEDVINIALTNNDKIKQYNEKLKQKEFQDLESWGNFLPVVNITGSYNHMNDPIMMDLEPIRQAMITLQASNQVEFANVYNIIQKNAPLTDAARAQYYKTFFGQLDSKLPKFQSTLKKQDYKSASFTAVQPIFMGGKLLAAKNYSQDEKLSADIELTQIKNEITAEATTNYLNVVFLLDLVKTRENVLADVLKHRDKAKRLFAEGVIANYNVLRAEVAVSEAERNLLADKNKLKVAYLALKTTLGMELSENVSVEDTLVYTPMQDSLLNLEKTASVKQPVLQLISLKKDAAKQKFNVERSNFLPTIAAFGKYELYPQYLSMLEPRWIVGVQASFNIFNGFKDYSKLQAASHLEKEVQYIELDAQRKINLLVNKNYSDVIDSRDRYEKTNSSISLAKENLRLNEKRFESGLGTSLEVIDAQLSLEKANIDSKNAVYDYYKALVQLYQSTGEPETVLSIWKVKGN
ncbi:MAG: TolC family protein [Bacteroidota bacterium]|nr:TolC family protein [Bacteroidota bacterium]